MISAISVKDRLKNQAVASGKTFQEALTAYGLERTVPVCIPKKEEFIIAALKYFRVLPAESSKLQIPDW